jgi:hypothetical protein
MINTGIITTRIAPIDIYSPIKNAITKIIDDKIHIISFFFILVSI